MLFLLTPTGTRPVDENLSSISALARSTPLLLPHEGPLVQQTFFFGSSSNSNSDLSASSLPSAREHPLFYLGVYFAISFGFVLTGLVRNLVGYLGKYRASKKLHSKVSRVKDAETHSDTRLSFSIQLLRSIMRATPRWFDTTPTGRITNRFTSDMGQSSLRNWHPNGSDFVPLLFQVPSTGTSST